MGSACALSALFPGRAPAQAKRLPDFPFSVSIEDVPLVFAIRTAVERSAAGPINVVTTIALSDLISKIDTLINAVWDDLGGRLRHNGTLLSIEGDRMRAKVHFRVRPGGVPSSNGSVVAYFSLSVANNEVGATGMVTELNISNDVTRNVAKALNLDDKLKGKLNEVLSKALSAPKMKFALPPLAQALGVTLEGATFGIVEGQPALTATGTLPTAAASLLGL